MNLYILPDPESLGREAAKKAAAILNQAISERGAARLVLATGQSQFETLQALVQENIDWSKVDLFHLDEYIGLPESHPASFRRYLKERFISQVRLKEVHLVDGEADLDQTLARLNSAITEKPVDLGMIGIGENAHIAFNDPPADFSAADPYIVVELDQACKQQQVREGWFETLQHVPEKAISMSVHQILQCRQIISCVPHQVKAEAVQKTLSQPISEQVPATALQGHSDWHLYLDTASASLLDQKLIRGELK